MVVGVLRWTLWALTIAVIFACPENEEQAECVNPCNTCESRGPCPLICTPGCNCIQGFVRDSNNVCVPRGLCPATVPAVPVVKEVDGEDSGGCPILFRCIQSCRRRGFRTGYCGGRFQRSCRCRGASQDTDTGISPADNLGCPNINLCSRHCRNRGYRFGRCVGPLARTCRCVGPWSTTGDPRDGDSLPVVDTGGCPSSRVCRRICRRRGFRTGICTGIERRTCRCFGRLRGDDEPSEYDGSTDVEAEDSGGCPLVFLCIRSCRRQGFRVGVCIGRRRTFCRCLGRSSNDEVPEEIEGEVKEEDSGGCPLVFLCVRSCRRQGLRIGICIGQGRRTCRCLGGSTDENVPVETEGEIEDEDSGGCPIVPACVYSCRRRGYTFGICIRRYCKCFRRREDDQELPIEPTDDGPSFYDEGEGISRCPNPILCTNYCRNGGYDDGICSGPDKKLCLCYTGNPPSDEIGNESGGCPNTFRCIRSCKRRGYHSGRCFRGICRCYGQGV